MLKKIAAFTAVALATTCIAGCVRDKGNTMPPSTAPRVTYSQATTRAQRYVHDIVAHVAPHGKLTTSPAGKSPSIKYCSDSDNPPRRTPVNIEYDYKIAGVDHTEIDQYFKEFQQYLEKNGWDSGITGQKQGQSRWESLTTQSCSGTPGAC